MFVIFYVMLFVIMGFLCLKVLVELKLLDISFIFIYFEINLNNVMCIFCLIFEDDEVFRVGLDDLN